MCKDFQHKLKEIFFNLSKIISLCEAKNSDGGPITKEIYV